MDPTTAPRPPRPRVNTFHHPEKLLALTTTTLLSATQNARLDNPMTTIRNRAKRVIPR
jgi:hypothetical protein